MNKFLGVCLVYIKDKDSLNKDVTCEISYMSKRRGETVIHIAEDKNKEAKMIDYSNAPKRTIKTTIIEAVTLNPIPKGTFVKLNVGKQEY